MQQFDPNIPGLIEGQVTTVIVTDPANTFPGFEVGNHVMNPDEPFDITVKWEVSGLLFKLWQKALGGNWNVQAYAESVGGGPEILIGRDDTVAAVPAQSQYEVTFTVPAGTLQEGNPGDNVSGIYKLVVSVFLNSDLGAPGFDMVGFSEGPIIQVENTL